MSVRNINGCDYTVDVDPGTPILWTLRDTLGMTGTKFGCGAALCGACKVHLDGQAIRSCVTPVVAAQGRKIIGSPQFMDGGRGNTRRPRHAPTAPARLSDKGGG